MATNARALDISDAPELLRVAEEVRASNRPCVLKRGDEEVAVLMPPRHRKRRLAPKKLTEEDIEAFRSSAGGWAGLVDTDKLIEDIYADRRASIERGSSRDLSDR